MSTNRTPNEPSASAGRPRDARLDELILLATVELLEDVSYAQLSIAAIAARAGTTKPTIYRRWPTKAELVHQAVFPVDLDNSVPDSDDLEADIRLMVEETAALFSRPVARNAIPGLLAEFASDPELHQRLNARFAEGVWGGFGRRMERAIRGGSARADADTAVTLEAIAGASLMAASLRPDAATDEAWVRVVVRLLMHGLEA